MPTVELHGFSAVVRKKIWHRLTKLKLNGIPVFIAYPMKPKTMRGKPAPFLRVYSRFPANPQRIRTTLRGKFDIEFVRIKFWPRKRG